MRRMQNDPRAIEAGLRVDIRRLMELRGVSQRALAAKLECSQAYITKQLRPTGQLSLGFVTAALGVLGADLVVRELSAEEWEFADD